MKSEMQLACELVKVLDGVPMETCQTLYSIIGGISA